MKDIMRSIITYIHSNFDNKNGIGKINNEVYEMCFLYVLIQIEKIINTLNIVANDIHNITWKDVELTIDILSFQGNN